MLGQPSLQYSIGRYLYSLLSALASLFTSLFASVRESWKVVKSRYLANFEKYQGYIHNYSNVTLPRTTFSQASDYIGIAVDVIIAAILAMIATIIGANLIGPVATAVGGALNNKNLTGAANSLTAQLTLLFVVVVILIPVTFIAVFGKIVKQETA